MKWESIMYPSCGSIQRVGVFRRVHTKGNSTGIMLGKTPKLHNHCTLVYPRVQYFDPML